MKTKLILDITKSQQAQLNAVVTGRQGDKGTVTVNVFVVDGGVPVNLTGHTIYYEGLKPNNAYVRDTSGVKIINATQGNFEYTFRPETFGVAGVGKRSYFSIEQGGTVRASTQDFGLVTLADAMTGNTMSGPYISELEQLIQEAKWLVDDINSRWTSINDQLYQLQTKLDTMDVVRRSGDTMIGPLVFDTNSILRIKGETGKRDWLFYRNSAQDSFIIVPRLADNSDWEWSKQIEFRPNNFIVNGDTNLVKKTGDNLGGEFTFFNGNPMKFKPEGKTWWNLNTANGLFYLAPSTTPTGANDWNWDKAVWVNPNGTIHQAMDTDWTTIPLQPNINNIDGRTTQARRTGGTVTVQATYRAKSVTNNRVMQLPQPFRPDRPIDTHVVDGAGRAARVIVDPDGWVYCSTVNEDVRFTLTYTV
ncbi:BppU family phage baseplate upper protein [Bacillus cereus]|uniref:BppU family phage baseplate upper protein n=1 Tax=Bacillus cereus TaxID=1396 RepID=UPI003A8CA3A1